MSDRSSCRKITRKGKKERKGGEGTYKGRFKIEVHRPQRCVLTDLNDLRTRTTFRLVTQSKTNVSPLQPLTTRAKKAGEGGKGGTNQSSQLRSTRSLLHSHLAQADLKDLDARLERGRSDVEDPIDPSWSQQRRILPNPVIKRKAVSLPSAAERGAASTLERREGGRTITSGRFVAATTVTPTNSSTPSISFKMDVKMPLVWDDSDSSLDVHRASISSCTREKSKKRAEMN